jgi:hypothetical protein
MTATNAQNQLASTSTTTSRTPFTLPDCLTPTSDELINNKYVILKGVKILVALITMLRSPSGLALAALFPPHSRVAIDWSEYRNDYEAPDSLLLHVHYHQKGPS